MSTQYRRPSPWLVGLLAATIVAQGVAVGARIADERSTDGRPQAGPTRTPRRGEVASDDARRRLCGRGDVPSPEAQPTGGGELPGALQAVADAVEEIRGLDFVHPVQPEAVTREEIAGRLERALRASFPTERLARRTLAWRAMGVLPPDAELGAEIREFSTGAIIGYYDTITKELVYVGTDDPTPYQRVTLAHELTHALDDQHFDLSRLDVLDAECRDDEFIAGVAVAEGSASDVEIRYVTDLTNEERQQYLAEATAGASIPDVSPFVSSLLLFPYGPGHTFVQLLQRSSGLDAVDRALDEFPASTEQILHPDRFPEDEPTDVDAPDVSVALQGRWREIDVYDVGEAWLLLALGLRIGEARASAAAAGWDGGEYRAWRRGGEVAVVLETVWDSEDEAAEFLTEMRRYLRGTASGTVSRASRRGDRVIVLWAKTPAQLEAMASVLRG